MFIIFGSRSSQRVPKSRSIEPVKLEMRLAPSPPTPNLNVDPIERHFRNKNNFDAPLPRPTLKFGVGGGRSIDIDEELLSIINYFPNYNERAQLRLYGFPRRPTAKIRPRPMAE